jgi:hypothetical protein
VLVENRINGRRLGTARPFPLWRLHSGPAVIVCRSIFGNAPRTSGINCNRDDAQIGGYPPLPLKKIGRRNGACVPCWACYSLSPLFDALTAVRTDFAVAMLSSSHSGMPADMPILP